MSEPWLTLLSNGYGEDVIAALLAAEFRRQQPDIELRAYPTVDRGSAFETLGIPILGPRRAMPSGGMLFHSLPLLLQDLRAGFPSMTYRQLTDLRQLHTNALVIVGDVYALALSALVKTSRRFYVQPLISAYHAEGASSRRWRQPQRLFMEEYTGLETFLMRRFVEHTYVRDALTAAYLERWGLKVSALGNPMLDALRPEKPLELSLNSPVVALLPGTRRYATESLTLMLSALGRWPQATGLVAWAQERLDPDAFAGWRVDQSQTPQPGLSCVLARGGQCVYVFKGRFAAVLQAANLTLGTAGTGNEQAAALGRPVVAFPVPPLYTKAFLHNQKRLLAEALTVVEPDPATIARALKTLWQDKARYQAAGVIGKARMGEPGGAAAIVRDILRRLEIRDTVA